MTLRENFDAVLMLTWSDWEREPRSNRYHYATRFARSLPVFFLQHLYKERDGIAIEPSGAANIDIVSVSQNLRERDVGELRQLLAARGVRRPLIWIYDSLHYQPLLDALPRAFRVYHATEDYLTKTKGWNQGMELTGKSVIDMLSQVDFLVACTDGVANSYLTSGGYKGPHVVITNGCDAEYLLEQVKRNDINGPVGSKPVAIFQGGINQRLDYELLLDVIRSMPGWEFRFCGAAVASQGWHGILEQANVHYLGEMLPEDFARQMCEATVGIIPYIQDEWIRNSLPLKAYEYVACGLPVVTVPIRALERNANLFETATSAVEFAAAIRRVADSRYAPGLLDIRRRVALENSYDVRFESMCQSLLAVRVQLSRARKRLTIAVLYDCMGSMHVSTIEEHLEAFRRYSRHAITYVPATPEFWSRPSDEVLRLVDLSVFDTVIVHYSIRLSVASHLDEGLARALENYSGLKILFLQDEYEGTEIARSWMDRLRFDVVYTCVPAEGLNYVYPPHRFPYTDFLPTLTGYVPEDPSLEEYAKPLSERKVLIAYRGRKLPAVYGELGFEKYRIGVEMKIIAGLRGLPVDIEVDDTKRIYGSKWYEFLGSARATLGTESGANVFDFTGDLRVEIKRLEAESPAISFGEIAARVLAPHEGRVQMNQISPKVFEAIRLRTALILFEGSYSDVVRPDEHFIPLRKDFSNIDDVLAKIQDDEYLRRLTDRAYQDVVGSGAFSYKHFIDTVDTDIERRIFRSKFQNLVRGPLFSVAADGSLRQILPVLPVEIAAGPHPLGYPMSALELAAVLSPEFGAVSRGESANASQATTTTISAAIVRPMYRMLSPGLKWIWRHLPLEWKNRVLSTLQALRVWIDTRRDSRTLLFRIVRRGWHLLPAPTRRSLAQRLERR